MKKTLSVLPLLGIVSLAGMQTVSAFSWSNLNPMNWGKCNRCEKVKPKCGCQPKTDCPCTTGAAAPCVKKVPCDPCNREVTNPYPPCDECDRLQQEMAK